MVIRQQRCTGKADAGRRGQQVHHVVCKNAVLATVGFIRQNQNVVIRVDGRLLGQIELLDQGKHKAGVALQLFYKVCTAGCNELRSLCLAQQTAVFKGIADLPVQLVTVGQYHNGGRACKLAPDLLRQKDHGVAFARPLRVPEHTQPAVFQLAVLVSTDGLVDAEILVVAGQNLGGAPTGMVVKDEVFQQIEEGLFLADAPQHGFQFHAACIAFLQTLPLVEKLVLAAKRTHLGFQSIGQHEKGIIVEQLRNGIEVIPIVVYVGVLHIHGGLFQLDKQQRNAIDKAHNVCPAAVQLRVNLHLFYGKEVVVFRVFEVDHRRASDFGAAIRPLDRHRDAIPQQKILFLVDLHQGCGGNVRREFLLHLVQLVRGEPRVQPQKRLPKIPGQQHFPIAGAA